MTYHSALVTITGTVSISQDDMEDRLQQKYPQYAEAVEADEDASAVDLCTALEEKETFEELAREQIRHAYDDAQPLDMNMVEIDLSTYRNK